MNKVYNNYISGSVSQVSGCLEIILYNKSNFSERISLYNLEDFYLSNLIRTSTKYARITRKEVWNEGVNVPFEYKKLLPDGFNVIVYISSVSNSPVGYSEFVNTQGVGVTLDITINISRVLKGEIEIELSNKLVGKDLSKNYLGDEPYNYVTQKEIKSNKYRNLFTSNTGRTESDIYSFIIGSSGITSKNESWRLKVNKEVEINNSFLNYNVCFYDGNLVLAAWTEKNYGLYSLIGDNPSIMGTTTKKIKRIEGRYYFDTDEVLRYLETEEEVTKKNNKLVCDFLDQHCKVYDLPVFYSRSTIFKYIPEINNIYLDLNNYLKSSQVNIYAKIGSWFILSREYSGTNIYTAISPTSVINMAEEDLDLALFVGDQTMILCEPGESLNYYLVYNIFGKELTTERARAILYNGRLDQRELEGNEEYNFLYCFLDTEEDDIHFEEYYGDNGLVYVIYETEDLSNTILEKYRRNVYPSCKGIPQLIGSYCGLIFYRIGSKVNYL